METKLGGFCFKRIVMTAGVTQQNLGLQFLGQTYWHVPQLAE